MCPIETLIHNFTKIQTLTEKEKGFLSQQKIQHKIQQFFKRILQLVKNDLIILLAINYLRGHDCILGEIFGTVFTNWFFMLFGVETS